MTQIDPSYIVYVGVFIGALFAFEGLRHLLSRGEDVKAARSRRMRMIEKGATPREILQLLRPREDHGLIGALPLVSQLPKRLRQAGITMAPPVFLVLCLAGGAALGFAVSRVAGFLPALGAAPLGVLVPLAVVASRRRQRMQKLIGQLPDALDLMSRGLRVGHPLNTTIASVANEMPDPIGTEFGVILDQVSHGDDIVTAFKEMAQRIDEEDLHYLAVSIGIQHGTGGNLARVLGVLAKVIRDRAMMRRKIKAISAEGRVSMWILSALPAVIFGAVNVMSPEFYGGVSDHPMFMPIMTAIVVLVVANFLALRKLVSFRF